MLEECFFMDTHKTTRSLPQWGMCPIFEDTMLLNRCAVFIVCILFASCAAPRYVPEKKFHREELVQDYDLMTRILQEKHPSLYWYTPADSMQWYMNHYREQIQDSMTEKDFIWKIMSPLLHQVHCGHTTAAMSKGLTKHLKGKRYGSFPFYVKVWGDTMVVTGSQQPDSVIRYGTVIHAINDIPAAEIIRRCFEYLPADGYAQNLNYIRLSSNFPYYLENIVGPSKTYTLTYSQGSPNHSRYSVNAFVPVKDTTPAVKAKAAVKKQPPRRITNQRYRSMTIDSTGAYAYMAIHTFNRGNLSPFIRKSFRTLRREQVPNLIIDIRNNRGGKIRLSTLFTKFISEKPFRVADTVYANDNTLKPYTRHFKGRWLNNLQLFFTTHRKRDGLYHMGFFSRRLYKPKKKNHYNGNVYVITGGPTFSAATLFANTVKGQHNVTLVGEETGGGWHGNSGVMLPQVTLPNTRSRFTLPLFRVVQYNHVPKTGTGILPDWEIPPSYPAILKREDHKLKMVTDSIFRSGPYNRIKASPSRKKGN